MPPTVSFVYFLLYFLSGHKFTTYSTYMASLFFCSSYSPALKTRVYTVIIEPISPVTLTESAGGLARAENTLVILEAVCSGVQKPPNTENVLVITFFPTTIINGIKERSLHGKHFYWLGQQGTASQSSPTLAAHLTKVIDRVQFMKQALPFCNDHTEKVKSGGIFNVS